MKNEAILQWYDDNKTTVDRIINDLRKTSCAGMMHIYSYTSRQLKLTYTVSQKDFPMLFSNNYTRVGDTLSGIMALLLNEWNLNLSPDRIRKSLEYWLLYSDMYETFISKVINKTKEAKERVEQKGWMEMKKQLIATSIQNGIKSQGMWNCFFNDEEEAHGDDHVVDVVALSKPEREIPIEFQSEKAQRYLRRAIEAGLCDENYQWLKTKMLLAYFADIACDKLSLSRAEQDGKPKTNWKPFETLFGISGLSFSRNIYRNKTGNLPKGFEEVDSIFHS